MRAAQWSLSVALHLALAAYSIPVCTASAPPALAPLRVVFAPHPFLSHWAVSAPVAQELLDRGHRVLFVASTQDQYKSFSLSSHPNVTIAIYQAPRSEAHLRETMNDCRGSPMRAVLMAFFDVCAYSDVMLTDRTLIRKVQDFGGDLFVADPGNLGGWALADVLQMPKAILQVPGFHPPMDADLYGHGSHAPTYVPTFGSVLPTRMTLLQRCRNVAHWVVVMMSWRGFLDFFASYFIWWKHNIAPYSYRESGRNSSLVLINSHFALSTPRPLGPKVHVVGPLTARAPRPLPAELEAFMRQAGPSGVVYASLGYTAIPEKEELWSVAQALGALAPTSVLWKLTAADQAQLGVGERVGVGNTTLPWNIRLIEWAPQNDVLGHPATKVFLTQAGTNSFNEAAYHGVPVVGLPLWGEQPDNVARAVEKGFGLRVSIDDTQNLARNLHAALHRVLDNPSFAQQAAKVSNIIRSTRESPASQAASWIEHAAWTKGNDYLDTPVRHMPWYQQMLLDVWGVYLGCLITVGAAVRFGTVAYRQYKKHLKLL